jgi:transposase
VTSVAVTGRADLTDAQWARLAPLLPRPKKTGRPSMWTKRQLIDGIRWRTRVGSPWRDVPPQYGSWQAIYRLFRRWQRAGAWVFILKMLQAFAEASGEIDWQVSVDSTIMRATGIATPSSAVSTGSNNIGRWRPVSTVMINGCRLGRWSDPRFDWPRGLEFDLSTTVWGGACCRRTGLDVSR